MGLFVVPAVAVRKIGLYSFSMAAFRASPPLDIFITRSLASSPFGRNFLINSSSGWRHSARLPLAGSSSIRSRRVFFDVNGSFRKSSTVFIAEGLMWFLSNSLR